MRKIAVLTLLFLFLSLFGTVLATTPSEVIERLDEVDLLYAEYQKKPRENTESIRRAADIMEGLISKYPSNYQVLWTTAKVISGYASFSEDQATYLERGKGYAETATRLYPNSPEGHYWLAVLTGQVGMQKGGIMNSLSLVKPIRNSLEKAIEVDPTFADAYYMMGNIYFRVPGWPVSIGDKKKGLSYIEKAAALQSDNYPYQWTLYTTYRDSGKKREARNVLERIIEMPYAPENEETAQHYKRLAQNALENN